MRHNKPMVYNNLSDFLTSIKMDLGIYGLVLPIDVDEGMVDVLARKTNLIFSIFCPYKTTIKVDPGKLEHENNPTYQFTSIILPVEKMFPNQTLVHMIDVKPLTNIAGSGYATPIFNSDLNIYSNLMMAQVNADLLSAACPNFTWEFEGPDKLHLFNYSAVLGGDMLLTLGLTHPVNLSTIKPTTYEAFMELASLDIKAYLYNTVKQHDGLASALASIDLKIDDWREAAQKREELINQWKDVYHLDFPSFIII